MRYYVIMSIYYPYQLRKIIKNNIMYQHWIHWYDLARYTFFCNTVRKKGGVRKKVVYPTYLIRNKFFQRLSMQCNLVMPSMYIILTIWRSTADDSATHADPKKFKIQKKKKKYQKIKKRVFNSPSNVLNIATFNCRTLADSPVAR